MSKQNILARYSGSFYMHTPSIPSHDLGHSVSSEARDLITYEQAVSAMILPMSLLETDGKRCLLTAVTKKNPETWQLVKFLTNFEPYLIEVKEDVLREAIFIAFKQSNAVIERSLQEANDNNELSSHTKGVLSNLRKISTPENQLLCNLIDYSLAWDASDLHINPTDSGISISVRIAGELRTRDTQVRSQQMYEKLIQRLKIIAKLDITKRSLIQEGAFEVPLINGSVNARVSIVPAVHGESLSIRFFKKAFKGSLAQLGMPDKLQGYFSQAISHSSGLLLVCGATGSGKTTTLYALLNELLRQNKRIITIEDPVETILPGTQQLQVEDKKNLTFESLFRGALRQDPDIIMIGEVRDGQTARQLIQAALSGHLVLSSIHAGSISEALRRLSSFGIIDEELLICIRGICFQKMSVGNTIPSFVFSKDFKKDKKNGIVSILEIEVD